MMGILALFVLLPAVQETAVTVAAHGKDRRWVLVEAPAKGATAVEARTASGRALPAQVDGDVVRVLVDAVPAGEALKIVLAPAKEPMAGGLSLKEEGGAISVAGPAGEITRFLPAAGTANKKPCWYPLVGHGVNVLRGYPLEDRAGEARDHPHHTGIYHAFGDVNGKDYWSKVAIENRKVVRKTAGPAFARIVVENAWGEDLVETQDVLVLNAGPDAVLDWTFTLTAANGPVILGKDAKMAKEGSFSVRVGKELSAKGDAPDMMLDSLGNRGEKLIRQNAAPWVDYVGDFAGKRLGVSLMNHPDSWRYPSTWHCRAYGLFAVNPWYVGEAKNTGRPGPHTLEKGQSLVLKYRVYVHAGDTAEGKVAAAFEGYSHPQ
jgi:hypothetical protein